MTNDEAKVLLKTRVRHLLEHHALDQASFQALDIAVQAIDELQGLRELLKAKAEISRLKATEREKGLR